MIYRLSPGPTGVSARLVEQDPSANGGDEFEELGSRDANPRMLLDLITVRAGTEMARRSLTRTGSGRWELRHDEGRRADEAVGRIEAVGHYGWIATVRLGAPAPGQPRTDPPGGLLLFSRGLARRPCTGVTGYAIIWVSIVPDDHHIPMLMPEVRMSITEVEAAYTEAAR